MRRADVRKCAMCRWGPDRRRAGKEPLLCLENDEGETRHMRRASRFQRLLVPRKMVSGGSTSCRRLAPCGEQLNQSVHWSRHAGHGETRLAQEDI